MTPLGRMLVIAGGAIALIGVALIVMDRFSIPLGRLPGDIVWRGKNTTFYFPLTTLLLVNAAIALVMWLARRW
jgi:hypothetical protein